ncbi:MAG: hypothetical protein LQ345_003150 [Seirophora villosa]|nr:MAG: hypothetical protein LQ345_003150 [Seirophora villosa]
MLARASRSKLKHNAHHRLNSFPSHLYLPWLCPAWYNQTRHRLSSSIVVPPQATKRSRPALTRQKRPGPSARSEARGHASATSFDFVANADDYIPFEPQPGGQLPKAFQLPWKSTTRDVKLDHPDSDEPIIIRDSLTTRPSRFRSFDAISGEVDSIVSTMKACLHVGRFERAAALMRRLNAIYQPNAPTLLAAHNDYIREAAWKIASSTNQDLLKDLQKWFEVDLRGRGTIPDVTTYAFMIQATLHDASASRSNRSVRRYLHLAEEAGLRNHLMNALLSVLSEQDFGRVTRISSPEPTISTSIHPLDHETIASPSPTRSKTLLSDLPEVRPVDQNLAGWRALKQSMSVLSDPSDIASPEYLEGTEEDKIKRIDIERQLRMEQDTYESATEKWRTEFEQLKRLGINSALKHNSFGAMMWNWHQALEPTLREEIELANQAEGKAVKMKLEEERCQYGPFLQYIHPSKLSAITILTAMAALGTSQSSNRGVVLARMVNQIGHAVQVESLAEYLKVHRARRGNSGGKGKGKGLHTPSTAQALERFQWSIPTKIRVGAVLLSKLVDCAKVRVFRKHAETGSVLEAWQPALIHRSVYSNGRLVGMVRMNDAMYDHLAKDPVGASLAQKYLPMIVEPKSWVNFREGGYLTSTEPMVRLRECDEQGRRYITVAVDNGDMAQVCAGLDVLSRTPWQINGPVLETMLEAWNSGEAIGNIAPENPHIDLPAKPAGGDGSAHNRWLREVKEIGYQKAGYKSQRCFQNFQLEIARAYVNETFYFPHNVDFRGRAYPMSPFLNYMGADLSRGLLTFGVGKELGASGLRWLKIHLANVFGYDKASFAERQAFAEEHRPEIIDSADNPLGGQKWWLKAEDPWQCLAACKELRNALTSPDPNSFVSSLPVHQDGTCNGLQHYAALGGDAIGARQVNLEPGDRPSDIYTAVAELVQEAITDEAGQGLELARHLQDKISRKVVKQTVMTNVYGVTFMGARLQVRGILEELYPEFPKTDSVDHDKAAFYIAKKIFMALSNMFNGAHDIQYWLGDCASRIATAVTPEQMQRVEADRAGTLKELDEVQKKPLKRKGETGRKDEVLSFKQSVIWTSPLKMPVVQPYRKQVCEIVSTHIQKMSLKNPSLGDPVDRRKQLQAFPPNFIHSLDATHMILSALQCGKQSLTFSAVHDSFWTHASSVETMNHILRDAFITMHSEDIIGRLRREFVMRYKDCMYMAVVKARSSVGKKIIAWRGNSRSCLGGRKPLEAIHVDELVLERRRLKLLASPKPEERKEGETMVTAYSIFQGSDGEADLSVEESIADAALGNVSAARENKLQANERLWVGDESNIGSGDPVADEEAGVLDQHAGVEAAVDAVNAKPAAKRKGTNVWLWRPLTFPPVPKKDCNPQINEIYLTSNMSTEVITTISPATNTPTLTRNGLADSDIALLPTTATHAFNAYRHTSLQQRKAIVAKALTLLHGRHNVLAKELAEQMGRPIAYGSKEIITAVARGEYLLKICHDALKDTEGEPESGFKRYIRKLPIGPVLILFAWNYPYLILVNSLIPALLAGNSVILKPSPQTPTIAEHIQEIFSEAGLPPNVIQYFHCGSLQRIEGVVKSPQIKLICFTGSVAGGLAVQRAAADRIVSVGLELGGKDAAYVRADVDVKWAAEEIIDGAVFNSGQSCCSIERVYVAEKIHDQFVTAAQEVLKRYILGSPLDKETNVGPVISRRAKDVIEAHVKDALDKGATNATPDNASFSKLRPDGNYVPPTLLTGVTHDMDVMNEETFGPVIPVMKVGNDEEALLLMNDSEFGLTASIWTSDVSAGEKLAQEVDAGTVFVNRCDFPSPDLAWTGWKNSGKGVSLSKFGFEQFVRLKSFHLKEYPG